MKLILRTPLVQAKDISRCYGYSSVFNTLTPSSIEHGGTRTFSNMWYFRGNFRGIFVRY